MRCGLDSTQPRVNRSMLLAELVLRNQSIDFSHVGALAVQNVKHATTFATTVFVVSVTRAPQ